MFHEEARGIYVNVFPDSETCLLFLSLRLQLCTPGWAGREIYLSPLRSSLLPPTWQPQKLCSPPRSGDRWLCLLRRGCQTAERKPRLAVPKEFSGGFWLGPGSLQPGLLSTGDPLSEQKWKETVISASCSRDKTNPLTSPRPVLAYQMQPWNCSE